MNFDKKTILWLHFDRRSKYNIMENLMIKYAIKIGLKANEKKRIGGDEKISYPLMVL